MFTRTILLLLFASNVLSVGLTMLLSDHITQHMVFDIDLVRQKYLTDMRYYYFRGCSEGTDYPPEYRKATSNFNEHSVPIYCKELQDGYEQDFMRNIMTIGRKGSQ